MNEPIKYQMLPDEHIMEDETVSADELFCDLMAGFAELEAFEESSTACSSELTTIEGSKTLRVTEYVEGERLPPADLTVGQLEARRSARKEAAKSGQNSFAQAANDNGMHRKSVVAPELSSQETVEAK